MDDFTLPPGAVIDEVESGLPPGAVIDGEQQAEVVSEVAEAPFNPYSLADRLSVGAGILDLGVMGASAGVAEIVSGLSGLTALAISGDPDHAANRTKSVQNFLTIGPFTESGKKILESIAPPMSRADLAIKDFAEEHSDGSPAAAAAIEAGIWGSIDIATAAVPAGKAVVKSAQLRKIRRNVQADAERLGINLHLSDFTDDVADAAKIVGSETRGAEAENYVNALRNAEYLARVKRNSRYMEALDKDLFVTTSPIRRLGADLTKDLFDRGFDLDADDMLRVRKTLDDMHSPKLGFGAGQNLAVHFNQFELLRKRINTRITSSKGSEKAALTSIRRSIDDFMADEFNKAVIENGQIVSRGAISGDADGFSAYLSARKANTEWQWFNDTKVISDLIRKDTTPEQFSQWLIGASAVGAKKEAAQVLRKMKQLLGEDHPAIDAVRADFIYEITEPLLQMEPNYRQFANNYDKVLRKNKSLADELGLQQSDVDKLADFAAAARQMPASGHFYSVREVIQTVSRLGVGHSVAKGAARVTFATKVLNYVGRVEAVSKQQIIDAVASVRIDEPLIPKKTPVAAAFTAGAALSGMSDEENK